MIIGLIALGAALFAPDVNARVPADTWGNANGYDAVPAFRTWPPAAQEQYINAVVDITYLIALRNDRAQARCLSDWYDFDHAAAFAFILASAHIAPDDYLPHAVILSVLERKCGPMAYR